MAITKDRALVNSQNIRLAQAYSVTKEQLSLAADLIMETNTLHMNSEAVIAVAQVLATNYAAEVHRAAD